MMFSCNGSGSANDVLAWRWSKMKNDVLSRNNGKSESLLPRKYFLIEDEASMSRGIGSVKDSCNFHLSLRRQVIKRCVKVCIF